MTMHAWDDVSFYRGVLDEQPDAIRRVKDRAGLDPTKVSPLSHVDRNSSRFPVW